MDKSVLKQFLKAGFVFREELFPTDEGTPQGGVISPILANMALDGMQQVLSDHFDLSVKGEVSAFVHNKSKVNLVRYADDFIVTAATKEIAEEAKEVIRDFLQTRGLELSEEKTVITHIDDGFDMLGWTFRKFKGKLIVKPSKKALKALKSALSETILGRGKAWKQEVLIEKLNQQIRGWTNYHQSVCASEAFAHIDYILSRDSGGYPPTTGTAKGTGTGCSAPRIRNSCGWITSPLSAIPKYEWTQTPILTPNTSWTANSSKV